MRDTIQWRELLEQLVARKDIGAAFLGPRRDYFSKRLWLLVSRVLDAEQVELEPLERALLQGELLNHFFPEGLPREE